LSTVDLFSKKKILFCFSYAGGSATVYNKFNQYLDKNIKMIPIEYAGRGKRINEEFYTNISCAIDDIYKEISQHINEYEFAFFGHSMGTVIAYEVGKRVKEKCDREPVHIFVSGRYPPHINKRDNYLHMLPDDRFKDEILKVGGTPKEVFENKEFTELFIPILRADYKLIELYTSDEVITKFDSGITVLSGKDDKIVQRDEMLEWQKYSMHGIDLYEFDGGHFFINNCFKEIAEIINSTLNCNIIPV
jgi:surfactin synthase thioesterase subunit